MRSAGSPSLLLVLVPGLALAALGARAVSAEIDAARSDARDRARDAAQGRLPDAVALSASGEQVTLRVTREIENDGGVVQALVGGDVPVATAGSDAASAR